jgi:hypothetical protein
MADASPAGCQHRVADGNGDLVSRKGFQHAEGLSPARTKPANSLDKAASAAVAEIRWLVRMAGADEPVDLIVRLVPVELDVLYRRLVTAPIEAWGYRP